MFAITIERTGEYLEVLDLRVAGRLAKSWTGYEDEWDRPGEEPCAWCGHHEVFHHEDLSHTMDGCYAPGCSCDGYMDLDERSDWEAEELGCPASGVPSPLGGGGTPSGSPTTASPATAAMDDREWAEWARSKLSPEEMYDDQS